MPKKGQNRAKSNKKVIKQEAIPASLPKTVIKKAKTITREDIFIWIPGISIPEMYAYQTDFIACLTNIFHEKGAVIISGQTKPKGLNLAKIKFYLTEDGFDKLDMDALRKIVESMTTKVANGLYALVC